MASLPNLAAAFVAAQAELATLELTKDREVLVPHKDGTSHTYVYATMTNLFKVVTPVITKHGLAFSAMPTRGADDRFILRYMIIHKSGEILAGDVPVKFEGGIQQMGGSLSYLRRYAFVMAFNLAPEGETDDDGNAAQAAYEAAQAPPSAQRRSAATAGRQRASRSSKAAAQDVSPDLPDAPAEELRRGVTQPMQQKLILQFKDLEFRAGKKIERDRRLQMVSELVGRPVDTITALSFAEGQQLINTLDDALQRNDPIAYLDRLSAGPGDGSSE
jgi:hypothetical protein